MPLQQLRRIRWAVRATLLFGVAASVAANVLHALPNPVSQGIAAWPPLALMLAVELISRIPMHRRSLAAARLISTAAIASIAAYVSYWHMVGVASRYGESETSAYLMPLSVDGLIVVASVSLVELAGRIRMVEGELNRPTAAQAPVPAPAQPPVAAPVFAAPPPFVPAPPLVAVPELPVPVSPAVPAMRSANPLGLPDFTWTADTAALTTSARRSTPQVMPKAATASASSRTTATASVPARPATAPEFAAPRFEDAAEDAPEIEPVAEGDDVAEPKPAKATAKPRNTAANKAVGRAEVPKQRRSVAETAALVAEIQADDPTISSQDLAQKLGISVSRLRAVRREAAQLELTDAAV